MPARGDRRAGPPVPAGPSLLRSPWLLATLVVGLLARAVLLPITHGQDFVVWYRAAGATLAGVNIYAHHPNYPGGPYAYLPPFLYLELPFRWLADHTGQSFVVLGKLPILVADVACALLIASIVRLRGGNEYTSAVGAAAFFVNPLVLYNSAYYGRFDSVGLALLLAASRSVYVARTRRARTGGALWFAAAAVVKTFPVVLLPWLLRWNPFGRWRVILTGIAVGIVVCIPYLTTLSDVYRDVVLYDARKQPQGMSWQYLLNAHLAFDSAVRLSNWILVLFVLGAIWLTRVPDPVRYAAVVFALFIVCSKVVLEQYLTWPLPFLAIMVGVGPRSRATALAVVLTVIGMVDNETFHPLGVSSWPIVLVLMLACVGYLLADSRRRDQPVGAGTGP